MSIRTIRTALLAAALVAGVASAAQAQDARVSFRRSALATSAGRDLVLARIKRAVAEACPSAGHIVETQAQRSCKTELTAQMVGRVGSPALTALWSGQPAPELASAGR